MVAVYGLNERLGNITYYDSSGQNEYQFDKPYSERTAEVIDEEISKLIEGQYERAKELLRGNREKLEALAQELLTKEVIFRDNLVEIFGERPWKSREERLAAIEEAPVAVADDVAADPTELPLAAAPSEPADEAPVSDAPSEASTEGKQVSNDGDEA